MGIVFLGWVGDILTATIVTVVVSFILLSYKEIKDHEKNLNELQNPTPDDNYAKAKQAIDKKVEELRKELTSALEADVAVHIFEDKYPRMYTIESHLHQFAGVVLVLSQKAPCQPL